MANCLYSGDKPLGIVQSNAEDIEYGDGSVKTALDDLGTLYKKTISGTTDSNGVIDTGLSASQYIYLGTTYTASYIIIPINAISNGNIKLKLMQAETLQPMPSVSVSSPAYFLKLPTS